MAAVPATTRRIAASTWACTAGRWVRNVPRITARCGIWLAAPPPSSMQTDTTAVSSGSTLRDTTDCIATSACAAASTGSRVRCGIAACPAWPSMVTTTREPCAITGPACTATSPAARPGQLW